MLSRLQATSQLARAFTGQNVICKRWSGHNSMQIRPSSSDWMIMKNWMHFYFILGAIPAAIITTILSIRANPELSETPDGYEPRYWEYYKHPITRWVAKHLFTPVEQDQETMLSLKEHLSEEYIFRKIIAKVDKVMSFYNDHRSLYFAPRHADYYRLGREDGFYLIPYHKSEMAQSSYEIAYDPDTKIIPVEGYHDVPMQED